MNLYEETLNNDWNKGKKNGIVIHFSNTTDNTDKIFERLKRYFAEYTPRACRPLYMIKSVPTHNFFAYFEYIEGIESPDQYKKKLKNILNVNVKIKVADYTLTVFPSNVFDTFFHYIFYCMEKMGGYDSSVVEFDTYRHKETNMEDELTQKNIDDYLNNTTFIKETLYKKDNYLNILQEVRDFIENQHKMTQKNIIISAEKEEQKREKEKIKNDRKKLRSLESHKKEKFRELVETNYEFTGNLDDYVTKTELCELSLYDDKSNRDTRKMTSILTHYDVIYDPHKQVNKKKGVYLGMRKLENKIV